MKKVLPAFILPFLLLSFVTPALAAPDDTGDNTTNVKITIGNPFKVGDNLYDLLKAVVDNVILPIGGVLCVLAFIFAGFQFVTAQGNPKKITDAKQTLIYAAIGTAILLGAWALAEVVRTTVNSLLS